MSERLGEAVNRALDNRPGTSVHLDHEGRTADVDVRASGPIGVTVGRVAVSAPRPELEELVAVLPEKLRALHEPIAPVEVDRTLGGASLRTRPEDMRDSEYFEVEVRGDAVSIERYRVDSDGRHAVDFDMTRKQLGKLIDELS